MKPSRRFLIRLAASVTRLRNEDRLREELEQHVALQTAEHVRAGLSPAGARRQAMISAALLVQSLRSLNSVDPGFRADHVLLISLDPKAAGYDSNRMQGFWRDTLEGVSHVPGVESVSLAGTVPLAPGRQRQPWLDANSGQTIELDTNFVGPRYSTRWTFRF